jgi:hypothetical protein
MPNYVSNRISELLDGGHWCKALLVPSDKVKKIIRVREK